jgi:hypothetical protein
MFLRFFVAFNAVSWKGDFDVDGQPRSRSLVFSGTI